MERFSALAPRIVARKAANVSAPKKTRSEIAKLAGGAVSTEKFSRRLGTIA
jgi:hypothetical protein